MPNASSVTVMITDASPIATTTDGTPITDATGARKITFIMLNIIINNDQTIDMDEVATAAEANMPVPKSTVVDWLNVAFMDCDKLCDLFSISERYPADCVAIGYWPVSVYPPFAIACVYNIAVNATAKHTSTTAPAMLRSSAITYTFNLYNTAPAIIAVIIITALTALNGTTPIRTTNNIPITPNAMPSNG